MKIRCPECLREQEVPGEGEVEFPDTEECLNIFLRKKNASL